MSKKKQIVDVAVVLSDASPKKTRPRRSTFGGSQRMRPMLDSEDLKGLSVDDVLDLLERHKIGHRLAMEYFGYERYDDLVQTMHANGRIMPGHQPMRIAPETMAIVRRIVRKG
jgi:hypothetical protein